MKDWNPGTLLQVSGSYWQTCTLHTAVKLDIFTRISSRPGASEALAKDLGLDARGLEVLLNALAAMSLLTKEGETFSCTPAALTFLSRESESYVGYMILHHHHLADSWIRMDQALAKGGPIRTTVASPDPIVRESFLMGMFNNAMAMAPKISQTLDLGGCASLLDLGGGPGTYAIHFCLDRPGLKAVVFDLPSTRPFAEKTIDRFRAGTQVSFAPGDYTCGPLDLTQTFDAAWLSHILHGEGPEMAEQIIEKAVRALNPGGRIFIHDFILNNTKDSPLFPALFSMNMFLGTEEGRSYSLEELYGMLERKGIQNIRQLDFKGPTESGILAGEKAS